MLWCIVLVIFILIGIICIIYNRIFKSSPYRKAKGGYAQIRPDKYGSCVWFDPESYIKPLFIKYSHYPEKYENTTISRELLKHGLSAEEITKTVLYPLGRFSTVYKNTYLRQVFKTLVKHSDKKFRELIESNEPLNIDSMIEMILGTDGYGKFLEAYKRTFLMCRAISGTDNDVRNLLSLVLGVPVSPDQAVPTTGGEFIFIIASRNIGQGNVDTTWKKKSGYKVSYVDAKSGKSTDEGKIPEYQPVYKSSVDSFKTMILKPHAGSNAENPYRLWYDETWGTNFKLQLVRLHNNDESKVKLAEIDTDHTKKETKDEVADVLPASTSKQSFLLLCEGMFKLSLTTPIPPNILYDALAVFLIIAGAVNVYACTTHWKTYNGPLSNSFYINGPSESSRPKRMIPEPIMPASDEPLPDDGDDDFLA